jgi:hypothetical protein
MPMLQIWDRPIPLEPKIYFQADALSLQFLCCIEFSLIQFDFLKFQRPPKEIEYKTSTISKMSTLL